MDVKAKDKQSFHIPLSDLMSYDQSPDPGEDLGPDRGVVEAQTAPELASNETDAAEGAIDMSIKRDAAVKREATSRLRCGVIVTNSSVVSPVNLAMNVASPSREKLLAESGHSPARKDVNGGQTYQPPHAVNRAPTKPPIPVNTPPAIATPLSMPHLYHPLPPPPTNFGLHPMDPKVPQGSMLSFLYSPYPGELPPPPNLPPTDKPVGFSPPSAPVAPTVPPTVPYPYNPLSAHYERMAAVAAANPFPRPAALDRAAEMGHVPRPSRTGKLTRVEDDDDDYDA